MLFIVSDLHIIIDYCNHFHLINWMSIPEKRNNELPGNSVLPTKLIHIHLFQIMALVIAIPKSLTGCVLVLCCTAVFLFIQLLVLSREH